MGHRKEAGLAQGPSTMHQYLGDLQGQAGAALPFLTL